MSDNRGQWKYGSHWGKFTGGIPIFKPADNTVPLSPSAAVAPDSRPHPKELNEREPWMMLPGVSAQSLLDILNNKRVNGDICDCHKCVHKFHELRFHLKAQADFDACPYRDGRDRRDMPAWFYANQGQYMIANRLTEE